VLPVSQPVTVVPAAGKVGEGTHTTAQAMSPLTAINTAVAVCIRAYAVIDEMYVLAAVVSTVREFEKQYFKS
jgi:hypothetical protein